MSMTNLSDDNMPDFKFNEDIYIDEIADYIISTYSQHYSKKQFQASEFIYDAGHGTGFNMGNVMKYAQRYGNKGTTDDHRKDLMKVIHYAILQLHVHDTSQDDLPMEPSVNQLRIPQELFTILAKHFFLVSSLVVIFQMLKKMITSYWNRINKKMKGLNTSNSVRYYVYCIANFDLNLYPEFL